MGEQEICTIERLDEIIARLRTVAFLEKILPSDHNDLVDAVKCIRDLVPLPSLVPCISEIWIQSYASTGCRRVQNL